MRDRLGGAAEFPEVLRDSHALDIESLELAHLEMRQPWPLPKERCNELVAEESLVGEIVRLHCREVVRELLHVDAVPRGASPQKRPSAGFPWQGLGHRVHGYSVALQSIDCLREGDQAWVSVSAFF